MAEHIWTVLCERQLIDPESQVISLIDLRENLIVEGLGQMIEEAVRLEKKGALVNAPTLLVSWWFRSDPTEEVLQARCALVNPDGKRLLEQPMTAPWGEDVIFSRIFLRFNRLPVLLPGLHWFTVEQQKKSKSKKPLWVTMTRIPLHIGQA